MAKELGFQPRSLIKNIPNKSQQWKLPVREWIRELHAKRFGEPTEPREVGDEQPAGPVAGIGPYDAADELLAQYNTVNGEPYFTHAGDGRVLSLEEAGEYLDKRARGEPVDDDEEGFGGDDEEWRPDADPTAEDIESQNQSMLRRQEHFRAAAEAVAKAMSQVSGVERIVLFGSVSRPLKMEVPRFREFRRSRIEVLHECNDVDLAVWVSHLDGLRAIQKARSQALKELEVSRSIGVAHHQVDVFLMEPGTDRYLGRLCCFNQCPKGKDKCRAPQCGATPFLQQHEDFTFDWPTVSQGSIPLFERQAAR